MMPGLPIIYVINAIVMPLLFLLVTRTRIDRPARLLRIGVLAILTWADACLLLWLDCHIRVLGIVALTVTYSSMVLPSSQTEEITRRLEGVRFPAYLLSIFMVSAMTHIHLPVSTFLTSPGELGIVMDYLLTHNTTYAMVFVFLGAALYSFALSPRMRTALSIVAMTAALVALVYSYLLPFGYPMMSGLIWEQIPISQKDLALRALVDGSMFFAAAVCVTFLILKLRPSSLVAGLIVLNVSLAATTAVTMWTETAEDGIGGAGGDRSVDRPLQLSKTEPNVVIIVLDRFMGGFIEPILEKEHDLNERLVGFTWYPRTIAAGQNSIAGSPPIFGGYDYTPREANKRNSNLRDLVVEAFRILPHNFSRKGYKSNIVNPRGLGFTLAGECSFIDDIEGMNCSHVSASVGRRMAEELGMPIEILSRANYADLLVLLGSMRGAPYAIKDVLGKQGPWQPFMDHSAGTTLRQVAELKALPELTGTHSGHSNFNVFWSILPHEPYFIGDDCIPTSGVFKPSIAELRRRGATSLIEEQHEIASRCALLFVTDYLDWMKAEGVYDNTKIVIVSDHGIVKRPVVDRSSRAREGNTMQYEFVESRSLLLVKNRNATGALRISESFIPNAEVPQIVCEEIGGCVNPFLGNKPIETAGRDDPFYVDVVPLQFNKQVPDGYVILRRLKMAGKDPYRREGWSEVPTTE